MHDPSPSSTREPALARALVVPTWLPLYLVVACPHAKACHFFAFLNDAMVIETMHKVNARRKRQKKGPHYFPQRLRKYAFLPKL